MDEAAQALSAFLDGKAMTQGTSPLTTFVQLCIQQRLYQGVAPEPTTPIWAQQSREQLFRQAVALIGLADLLNKMKAGAKTKELLSAADQIMQILFKRIADDSTALAECLEECVNLVCFVVVPIRILGVAVSFSV